MNHHTTEAFWHCYRNLPSAVQRVADRNFRLLKANPHHPSLHLKQIGRIWSVRAGASWRALGVDDEGDIIWFWIGSHADYDRLLKTAPK